MVAEHELTAEQLRERLNRALPGALATPAASANGTTASEEEAPAEATAADTLIVADRLIDVALFVRDQLGYALLSDIAITDYLAAGEFELVYIFFHPAGGGPLVIKLRVPRNQPEVASLTPLWPGAGLMEREGFDLFGVVFGGHPFLRRIYMWDEFDGFPMRKDFPKQGDKYLEEE